MKEEAKKPWAKNPRIAIVCGLCIFPLLILLARLWQVQVVQGEKYFEITRRQSTRFIISKPVRGQIYTSDGELLAGNRCHYDLTLHPSELRTKGGYISTSSYMLNLATFLEEKVVGRPSVHSVSSLRSQVRRDMAQPVVMFQDLTPEEIARCVEHTPPLPGVEITPRIERDYPHPGVATHLLGYTGWRNRTLQFTSEHVSYNTFTSRELLGSSGIEAQYDSYLSGRTGFKIVLIDSLGYVREELPGTVDSIDGQDVVLTLDSRAQIAADEALAEHKGALVAVDLRNGDILAMASAPSYNLADFKGSVFAKLNQDGENVPLMNRCLAARYAPGSIVKPAIALEGLTEGVFDEAWQHECKGYCVVKNVRINCSHKRGQGVLDLNKAMETSCNPFFVEIGVRLGLAGIQRCYEGFGFGKAVGLDVNAFQPGFSPSEETARRFWRRGWTLVDTAYAAIGHGGIEVTPLQVAMYAAALGNGGTLWRPHVIKRIVDKDGTIVRQSNPEVVNELHYSEENMAIVRAGMMATVYGDSGSAVALRKLPFKMAAKTGTATIGAGDSKYNNAWLICYGPLPNPTFAVACIIEHGRSGGSTAAPVVYSFLKKWQCQDEEKDDNE